MIINTNIEYKAKLVKFKCKYPKIGAFKPNKFVTSNCSKGELIVKYEIFIVGVNIFFIKTRPEAQKKQKNKLIIFFVCLRPCFYIPA